MVKKYDWDVLGPQIQQLKQAGKRNCDIAEALQISRSVVDRFYSMRRHGGFSAAGAAMIKPTNETKKIQTERELAGFDPLPAWHPIAAEALARGALIARALTSRPDPAE